MAASTIKSACSSHIFDIFILIALYKFYYLIYNFQSDSFKLHHKNHSFEKYNLHARKYVSFCQNLPKIKKFHLKCVNLNPSKLIGYA
ncbi:hypothetical protein GLYMA_15G131000v4 [Glycine max]|uniref:Uncharacterized protein n=1 Tax=Glycine max TaxID=3847 RepID=A0A0R0G6Z2_SOYBN|nr:hypothetical protein GYH30_042224 [Glycine max]KRH11794.1 hypothetical protein GLYMA_15G131000v4 [Glycine max]